MYYLLQCKRPNGEFVSISPWEDQMDDYHKWSNSPMQKKFLNFKMLDIQKEFLIKELDRNRLKFNVDMLKANRNYYNFANDLENNSIVDITNIKDWSDFILTTPKEIEVVNEH